jgi:small-conductance mechanosensitive channel
VWPKEAFSLGSNLTIFEEVVSLSIQVLSANFNWIHYNLVQIFPILIILLLAAGYLSTYRRILWTSLLFTIFSFQMGFTGNLATLEADGLYE